jgi:hypothetical protein
MVRNSSTCAPSKPKDAYDALGAKKHSGLYPQ